MRLTEQNPSTRRETWPSATLTNTNLKRTDLGSNPSDDRPATNSLPTPLKTAPRNFIYSIRTAQ